MTPARLLAAAAILFVIGAVLMLAGQRARHADAVRRREDAIKYAVYAAVIGGTLAALAFSRGLAIFLLAGITAGCAREIHHHLHGSSLRRGALAAALTVAVAVSLSRLLAPAGAWVVLLVAACDAFSQLWGRLLGHRPLCPRISPAKTIEGLAGGLLSTMLVAAWVGGASAGGGVRWPLSGAAIALAGTAGDLLFSAWKRSLGIKDFASTLPGHGGFLDRFDSLIVAAPLGAWLARWAACR